MKYTILLIVIAALGFFLRLYHVTWPIADWHSWRQSDTAAVARNFVRHGIDPLHPRYDDISNIQTGFDNPEGYRMVEFPLYQIVAASGFLVTKLGTIELWLRLISIVSSVGTGVLLALVVRRLGHPWVGLFSAFVFMVLPYNVFYGRSILPEVPMTFLYLGAIWAWLRFEQKQFIGWLLLSAVLAGSALLVKPVAAFFLLPVAVFYLSRLRFKPIYAVQGVVYALISFLPLYLWRRWIVQFPEGIAVYTWLFNEGNIRFTGAWFYWLFAERISKLILGYWGVAFLALGAMAKGVAREQILKLFWILGFFLYIIVIARGNVQHDYYQIPLIPIVALLVAHGVRVVWKSASVSKWSILTVGSFVFLLTLAFSWYTVRTFYWINKPEIVEAGKKANEILPVNARVIAPYNGDTTFLYQTGRKGWPVGIEIEDKIALGATHYVSVYPEDAETARMLVDYTPLVVEKNYVIVDLTSSQK